MVYCSVSSGMTLEINADDVCYSAQCVEVLLGGLAGLGEYDVVESRLMAWRRRPKNEDRYLQRTAPPVERSL